MARPRRTDWLLSAAGTVTIQGRTGDAAITNAVVAVGLYALAESGSGGLPAVRVGLHAVPRSPIRRPARSASRPATTRRARSPTPTSPRELTLTKVVDPAATGSGKVPADWTLTATPVAITGQGPVSGNGDPTTPGGVNAVTVFSGSYDLSETGPAGFAPAPGSARAAW